MPEDYREFVRGQEPECEVLVDDTWQPGYVRAWTRRDLAWWATVEWSPAPSENHLGVFHEDQVRQATP